MISYKKTSIDNDDSLRELNSIIDIKIEQENQIDIKNLANNFEELDFDTIELGKENIDKGNKLTTNKIAIENNLNKLKRFDFENLEKKVNEDYALKYIIENLKRLGNILNSTNILLFNYEKVKEFMENKKIKEIKVENNILNNKIDIQIKNGEILSLDSLIKNSKFLTLKIINCV
jgi:hypothetical protein